MRLVFGFSNFDGFLPLFLGYLIARLLGILFRRFRHQLRHLQHHRHYFSRPFRVPLLFQLHQAFHTGQSLLEFVQDSRTFGHQPGEAQLDTAHLVLHPQQLVEKEMVVPVVGLLLLEIDEIVLDENLAAQFDNLGPGVGIFLQGGPEVVFGEGKEVGVPHRTDVGGATVARLDACNKTRDGNSMFVFEALTMIFSEMLSWMLLIVLLAFDVENADLAKDTALSDPGKDKGAIFRHHLQTALLHDVQLTTDVPLTTHVLAGSEYLGPKLHANTVDIINTHCVSTGR